MPGPDHYRTAEDLTQKAHEYLGQGDGQDSAAVWAAVAQIHATLALAAATTLGTTATDGRGPGRRRGHQVLSGRSLGPQPPQHPRRTVDVPASGIMCVRRQGPATGYGPAPRFRQRP